ncbi:terminase family protein [Vibrio kagoshimensis]|uniref:terminase large subunit domain-containing protein n=1 Tax=Vibrio kagoshimensis TaxID=2910244 RepID=UPI003D2565D3
MAHSNEIKEAAKKLYLRGVPPKEIAAQLNLNSDRIIYTWAEKFGWALLLNELSVEEMVNRRLAVLIDKDEKSDQQLKEMDKLIDHHVKLLKAHADAKAKAERMLSQGSSKGNNSESSNQNRGGNGSNKKRRKGKNNVDDLTAEDFQEWISSLYDYQRLMRDVKNDTNMPRIRNALKSRQIGFTYGCSGEAFEDAVLTGRNQIFISASRAQSEVFRQYIIKIAMQFFGIELKGNPIILSNNAGLHFASTNASTAQSKSGNVYIDEYFWIRDFNKISSVVEGCATQSQYHITYFSTPSAKNHPAYPFWTGDEWKKGKESRANIDFPTIAELKDGGNVCPDKQWRYVIDVKSAVKGGCNLIDVEELEDEKSPSVFKNLYMCEFVDDSSSVFNFNNIEKLMVDPEIWQDFKPKNKRPFEHREVWLGYDPSRTRDNACLVVIAPPATTGEKFRVLEKYYWRGLNFQHHVSEIAKIFERYHVTYLGMDITGIGSGVFDLLQEKYPREVHPIHYSNESKNRLVLKMIDVVEAKRIQFSKEEKDIASAFMAIKRGATKSGQMMSFRADRSELVGHADAFWAISHALINEPLNQNKRKSTWATTQ